VAVVAAMVVVVDLLVVGKNQYPLMQLVGDE